MSLDKSPRLLVVRRDNIGDLVCTTPLLSALRGRYPDAWIGVLANSYNAPVLAGNPDIDQVFAYTKAKHRAAGESLLGLLWRRMGMLYDLSDLRLDEVILATPAPQPRGISMARWLSPRRIVGFGDLRGLDDSIPAAVEAQSEVEDVFRVARLHGIERDPPPCRVVPPPGVDKRTEFTVAVHISARKPSQRWPAQRFAEMLRLLHRDESVRFTLLWSPGDAANPQHPGDDAKAEELRALLGPDFPLEPVRTETLAQLIAALASCHAMICADGGAMHLAAGLGLPILALFGDSDAVRWRPWGVPYRLLQKPSRDVADIAPEEAAEAFNELLAGIRRPGPPGPS